MSIDPGNLKRLSEAIETEMLSDGEIPIAWVVVVDIAGKNGSRGMVTASGNAGGDEDIPPWQARGLIDWVSENAAYFFGETEEDNEDEDEPESE